MPEKQRPAGQGQAANEAQNEPNLSARLRAVQAQRTEREADEVQVDGFKPVLSEGWYEAVYLGHQTAVIFGGAFSFRRPRRSTQARFKLPG
jgi:hypothetical protein